MNQPESDSGFATPVDVETAYYSAFTECDALAMSKVWAEDGVVCIHPGAMPNVGRGAVMRSWTHILVNAARPGLRVETVSRSEGDGLAVHVVKEFITPNAEGGVMSIVVATNVYRREESGWHMLSHHASLLGTSPGQGMGPASDWPTLQ